MGYNFSCTPGCTLDNMHVDRCNALSAEEQMARAIVRTSLKAGVCPFCNTSFSTTPPNLHPDTCIVRVAFPIYYRAGLA